MFKVLKSLELEEDRSCVLADQTVFSNHLHLMKNGEFVSFGIKTPKSEFRMNEFIFRKLTDQVMKSFQRDDMMIQDYEFDKIKQELTSQNEKNLEGFSKNIVKFFKKCDFTINNPQQEILIEKFIDLPTERTHFTHKKNVDFTELKSKIAKTIRNSTNNEKTTIYMQAKTNNPSIEKKEDNVQLNFNNCLSNQSQTHILLIRLSLILNSNGTDQPIFLLIFPPSYATDLFRRFVYLETKPVGLKEFKHYHLDKKNLFFPNDFPSTKSYLKLMKIKVKST